MGHAHRQVLDELLAQVVVDAVDLLLGQVLVQVGGQLPEGLRVAAEWLLHDHPRPARPVRL